MVAFQGPSWGSSDGDDGVASSKSRLDPQPGTTQSGASRSVSPDMARKPARLCDSRKRGSFVESWYRSAKMVDGRVMYVCRAQIASAGAGGRVSASGDNDIRSFGCRPVGKSQEALNVALSESGWCRDGNENSVGSILLVGHPNPLICIMILTYLVSYPLPLLPEFPLTNVPPAMSSAPWKASQPRLD